MSCFVTFPASKKDPIVPKSRPPSFCPNDYLLDRQEACACWNSSKYREVLLTMVATILHWPSCLILFLLFHKPHSIVAKSSRFTFFSLYLTNWNKSKKLLGGSIRLGNLRLRKIHASLAISQSQKAWQGVLISPQYSHFSTIGICWSLSMVFIGRTSLHAHQMKFLIYLGILESKLISIASPCLIC